MGLWPSVDNWGSIFYLIFKNLNGDCTVRGALEKHLGLSEQEFYDEFDAFLRSGNVGSNPPKGWKTRDQEISKYANFLNWARIKSSFFIDQNFILVQFCFAVHDQIFWLYIYLIIIKNPALQALPFKFKQMMLYIGFF